MSARSWRSRERWKKCTEVISKYLFGWWSMQLNYDGNDDTVDGGDERSRLMAMVRACWVKEQTVIPICTLPFSPPASQDSTRGCCSYLKRERKRWANQYINDNHAECWRKIKKKNGKCWKVKNDRHEKANWRRKRNDGDGKNSTREHGREQKIKWKWNKIIRIRVRKRRYRWRRKRK